MKSFSFILLILISLKSQAIDWPQELTGTLSAQDCAQHFPNGKYVETAIAANKPEKFKLFYFSINKIDKQLPTFLYIDGGPGQASGAGPNTLRFTNLKNFNVVYFHPRGVGCSQLPADNQWDVTISTPTNSHDIEIVKQDIGISQWNIIFGVSYGTVSGLNYAELYPASVNKLVLEGLFNPSFPRDKVAIALQKGLPTLMAVYQTWPEYSSITVDKLQFIQTQISSLFQVGKAVNSKGVELNNQQINTLVVSLYTATYQGVHSLGSLNKNGIFSSANKLLKLFYSIEELPALPAIQYEFANDLPYTSIRVYSATSLNDSLEMDFITLLSDPTKSFADVMQEFYGDVLPYLQGNNTKNYKLIELPKKLAPHIQLIGLLGTEDGITYYEGALDYLKSLQSPYTLYGLKGFGHQRHFEDKCYDRVIEQINSNTSLDNLFLDKNSDCLLPEGFVRN